MKTIMGPLTLINILVPTFPTFFSVQLLNVHTFYLAQIE